jgi:hypothetical protein
MSTNAARNKIEIFPGRCRIFLVIGSTAHFAKTFKQSTKRAAESQAINTGLGGNGLVETPGLAMITKIAAA